MNTWQVARQLRYLLQQAKWEDGSTSVFAASSVLISAAPTADIFQDRRLPLAVIVPATGQDDPDADADYPEIVRREFRVTVVTAVQGDVVGEAAMLGANRSSVNDSAGRGLLEICEKVRTALLRADDDDGVRLNVFAASAAAGRPGTEMGYVAARELIFTATTTSSRYYRAALSITAVGGEEQVALTFGLPATRFDTYQLVLRRASGSTAPSSVTDGTGVTLGSNLPTSFTDTSLAGGTYSYALFMAYDEYGDGTNLRYSSSVVAEGITVTAASNRTLFQSDYWGSDYWGSGYWRAA